MPYQKLQLLTPTELLDIYSSPVLNEIELREHFTFNSDETKILKKYSNASDAVYFAICLVFFKKKHTLINFNYQDVTQERRHIMARYLPYKNIPKYFPKDRRIIAKIENHVLALCNYQRYTEETCTKLNLKKDLLKLAVNHPRQRQLCKAFLDLLIKNRIAIPGYTTIQNIVSEAWNQENNRVISSYLRYTSKTQRNLIGFLLIKTEKHHNIISIKQEMKSFNTNELWSEIEKYNRLKPIFKIARNTLPKMQLPTATINYYASLINYYNGTRLKNLDTNLAQFYLLCYSYTRYQILNDNLLEALKKRTLEYNKKANDYADEQKLKQLEAIKNIRKKVSDMLIAIKTYPDKNQIPRKEIYKYVPKTELLTTANLNNS